MDFGKSDAGNQARRFGHAFHIHNIRDVAAAAADVDSDTWFILVLFRRSVLITHTFPLLIAAGKCYHFARTAARF
jgi:hypothetical protein